MTPTRRKRLGSWIGLCLAIVALVLLAANLDGLELSRQGRALPPAAAQEPLEPLDVPGSPALGYVFAALLLLGVLLVPVVLVVIVRSRDARKELLRRLLPLIAFLAVLWWLRTWADSIEEPAGEPTLDWQTQQTAPPGLEESLPPASLEPAPDPPVWAVWLTTLALGLGLAGGLVAAARAAWRRTRRPAPALEELAREAQEAIDALQEGADLRDTVLRCYLAMTRILKREKGLSREEDMTPREFEASLLNAGLPGEQVHQLTRLFELARYGARAPLDAEARQALHCLGIIVRACRSAA